MLDHLRVRAEECKNVGQQHNTSTMITFWEHFAKVALVDEAELRAEALAESLQEAGDFVGCGWTKCPMFEHDDPAMVMLRCAGCRKTRYCGPACQTRYFVAFGVTLSRSGCSILFCPQGLGGR